MIVLFLIAATCVKSGGVIYKETHAPIEAGATPVVTIEIYASGYWTRVESGALGSNEAIGRSGCIDAAPIKRAVAAAGFAHAGCCCDALSSERLALEAPARKKKIATEIPCGPALDKQTEALHRLVHATLR